MAEGKRYRARVPCPICGVQMSPQGLVGHVRSHGAGSQGGGPAPGARTGPAPQAAKTLDEASFLDIIPKGLRITSTLFHIAKHVTEREWNWPQMEEGEWLDNYFYHTMRKFGIRLGGYVVERRGNGNHL